MLILDNNFFVYDTETQISAKDLGRLGELAQYGHLVVREYDGLGILVPYFESLNDGAQTQTVKTLIKNHGMPAIKNILGRAGIEETHVDNILESLKILENRQTIKEDISSYVKGNPQAVALLNKQKSVGEFKTQSPNVSLKQDHPTDKLFIQFPLDSMIVMNSSDNPIEVPDLDDVYKAYPNEIYQFPAITKILKASAQNRNDEIKEALEGYTSIGIKGLPSANEIISTFEPMHQDYVQGNPDNDLLEIQDNEKEYFQELINFFKHHIALYIRETVPGISDEEVSNQTEERYKRGDLPERVEEYIRRLISGLLKKAYSHTGFFPIDKNNWEDDAESSEDEGEDAGDLIILAQTTTLMMGARPAATVNQYLQAKAKEYSAEVWAEAIVRLARWGENKQANLLVGPGSSVDGVDLSTLKRYTHSVDISKMVPEPYEDGRNYKVMSYTPISFMLNGLAVDLDYLYLASISYLNPDNPEKLEQRFQLMTAYDIISSYQAGTSLLTGIDYVNGKFVAANEEADNLNESPLVNIKNIPPYSSEAFSDICMNLGIKQSLPFATGIVNPSALAAGGAVDIENAQKSILDQDPAFRPLALAKVFLEATKKAVHETQDEMEESDSFVETLNAIQEHVHPIVKKYLSSMGSREEVVTATAASFFDESLLGDSVAFDNVDEADEELEDLTVNRPVSYVAEGAQLEGALFVKLERKNKTAGDKLVGYFAMNHTPRIFASLKDKVAEQNLDLNTPAVNVLSVMRSMLSLETEERTNQALRADGTRENTFTKAVSETSLLEIQQALL